MWFEAWGDLVFQLVGAVTNAMWRAKKYGVETENTEVDLFMIYCWNSCKFVSFSTVKVTLDFQRFDQPFTILE